MDSRQINSRLFSLPDIQLWRRCPLGNRTLNRIMRFKNLSVCLYKSLFVFMISFSNKVYFINKKSKCSDLKRISSVVEY